MQPQQPRFGSQNTPAGHMARYPPTGFSGTPRPSFSPSPSMTGQINASRVGSSSSNVAAGGGMSQPMSSGGQTNMPHGYPAQSRLGKGKEKEKNIKEKDKDEREDSMHPPMAVGMNSPMHSASADRKRPAQPDPRMAQQMKMKKKKKVADKILPQRVRDLVPESQAYMDLLSFERKLDSTIMRKRLDIQEALKRPMKQKKKLRIFISNTYYPAKHEPEDGEESVASWELRVEGRLMEDSTKAHDPNKVKRKFSSFFKSLVIELDKDLYGPDNHLVEWHRTATTQETDGFQVKRPGDQNVKCTLLLMLDYQTLRCGAMVTTKTLLAFIQHLKSDYVWRTVVKPMQFKLDLRLARLLGIHTQTRPVIISALWQYIKTHKLQDPNEREFINCDKYLEQILECSRMKFSEIPNKLGPLLMPPDPIVINHVIMVEGPDAKKTACYDIDVEVDDTLKQQMNSFLLSTQSQHEIQALDNKIHETVETINQLKTNRDFFLGFAKNPQEFINNWLVSQTRDLKTMTDVAGNPEEERKADFYYQPWAQEAVCRYFYGKVQQRRVELEQALGIRNT